MATGAFGCGRGSDDLPQSPKTAENDGKSRANTDFSKPSNIQQIQANSSLFL